MKKLVFLLGLLIIILLFAFSQFNPGGGDRASISNISGSTVSEIKGVIVEANGMFEFEGFSVAKSHIGTFDDWTAFLILEKDKIVGVEGTIYPESVNTGIEGLDNHLKTDDFFETDKFPEIRFRSSSIVENIMTGNLEFRGVTKEISFPVELNTDSIVGNFFLDTTPFNIKYIGVNKEVRIKFDLRK
jgi:polyisoprenoid-binding protein YceI